jgi:alkylhydroperoxidase family enzyme
MCVSVWREVEKYSGRQRAALEGDESVTRLANQGVLDEVYRVPRDQFSEAELANLTLALIAINGWNRLNVAFRTPVSPHATAGAHYSSFQMRTGSQLGKEKMRTRGEIL